MLEMRPNCECCGNDLLPASEHAMICSFECTFCEACALQRFHGVCPNCGGEFTRRPVRPAPLLDKYPASTKRVHNPVCGESDRPRNRAVDNNQ
ncbi:MAG: DUF1272 domain-containing protein [Gammaproteobacteria bacterium]|nr:DUF1272 domain-containing protein [Gammaproteobacteria bacterium]MDE2346023.1 DUF1272 domain-containing protein [Gammaproteobacteria bacterium]